MAAPIRCGTFQKVRPKADKSGVLVKPVGRSGHCCAADSNNLYVFGGYNPHGSLGLGDGDLGYDALLELGVMGSLPNHDVMPEIWVFNFATKQWHKPKTQGVTPSAAASSSIKLIGDKLFVYGGTTFPFGNLMSNSLFVCDITNGFSWKRGEATGPGDQFPRAAYGQSIIIRDEYLYVFAGAVSFHLDPISDLHRMSLKTLKWECLTPKGTIPLGRYKQEVAVADEQNSFYVLGGGHLSGAVGLEKLQCYNFESNTWNCVTALPDPRYGIPKSRSSFGCVQRDNQVIISGGRHYKVDDFEVINAGLDDVWLLNLKDMQWTKLNVRLPKPTYFHSSALTPSGILYIYGGILEGEQRSSDIYKLQLYMPSLAEMAWDAVIGEFQDMNNLTRDTLVDLGVPHMYYERLGAIPIQKDDTENNK